MKFSAWILASALALAAPAIIHAAPANVAAAVAFKGRPADAREMDAGRKPVQVLNFLGLERGDRALDLFTGSGYYAEIMARAAGRTGAVVALQPAAFFNDETKKGWAALRRRTPNASLMLSSSPALQLAPASFDFVMLHLNYHDLYGFAPGTPTLPAELFAAVKPGGIVGVIDHVANAGGDAREAGGKLHRIDPALVRADFERAGFVLDGESDLLRNPSDDHSKPVFDEAVRGKTDRFVFRFKKPD
jgi:predicted methyltransferase